MQENTLTTITLDADTHIVKVLHASAWMIPDNFDQRSVVGMINE